jgi:hypothetical protein
MSHRPPRGAEGEPPPATPGTRVPCCPECPTDPWVVLAKVEIDASGSIQTIDNCACRRLVVSFAKHWWTCEARVPTIERVTPNQVQPASTGLVLTVHGEGFAQGLEAHLGEGIHVEDVTVSADGASFQAKVRIDAEAEPGPRTLTVRNPDCATATLADAVDVARPSGAGDERGGSSEATPPKRPRRTARP